MWSQPPGGCRQPRSRESAKYILISAFRFGKLVRRELVSIELDQFSLPFRMLGVRIDQPEKPSLSAFRSN